MVTNTRFVLLFVPGDGYAVRRYYTSHRNLYPNPYPNAKPTLAKNSAVDGHGLNPTRPRKKSGRHNLITGPAGSPTVQRQERCL